jgi:CRISPR-associated protein Csd1
MSWLQRLHETYENNITRIGDPNDPIPLLPLFHQLQNAQVHVVVSGHGEFLRASAVEKEDAQTIIPATEDSTSRSGGKIAPHALCDTLQYVAADYIQWGGNPTKKSNVSGFDPYIKNLRAWAERAENQKLSALLAYLRKGRLIADLVAHGVFIAKGGTLMLAWEGNGEAPPIFSILKRANKKGQFEAFVRFSVEIPGDTCAALWQDPSLWESWARHYLTLISHKGLCMVTGNAETELAGTHSKYIRNSGDGAKLISSNDTLGYTFRGRFVSAEQVCGIGSAATHKAHSALKWLIARQSYRDDTLVAVAWAVGGGRIPDPMGSTDAMLGFASEAAPDEATGGGTGTAEIYGRRLAQCMAGYGSMIGDTERIIVMVVDSATPGRMAIRYYRELTGSEFLERLQAWHSQCAWPQKYPKDRFVGAPAPRDIAEAAYVNILKSNASLRRSTVERLLPCIIDAAPLPRDIVESAVLRASSIHGIEHWQWEKSLGIACALYRYQHKERNYQMALERDRHTRDYLYGRLLALAHDLENSALGLAKEERDTNAMRLMQRFADRPASTWRTIELALSPYRARLKANMGGVLYLLEQEIDEVMIAFNPAEFASDSPLSGEFLLGFHCERAQQQLRRKKRKSDKEQQDIETASTLV